MKSVLGLLILAVGVGYLSEAAIAANLASDNAGNATYDSGWTAGLNGGTGFSKWTDNGNAILSVTDSTVMLGGPSLGINSPTTPPRAWRMAGNLGGAVLRGFTGGPLSIGQTFSVDMDNGYLYSTNIFSNIFQCNLFNSFGNAVWVFMYNSFLGGTYSVFDGSGTTATSLPFTTDGLHIDFTLTGIGTYSATITEQNGPSQTISGSLASPSGGATVNQFGGFSWGPDFLFFNNLAIIPEPATKYLVGLGLLGALTLRRRRSGTHHA